MRTSKFALIALVLLIGCGLLALPARAGFTLTLMQQGPNVVATGNGAIDLTGLTSVGFGQGGAGINPAAPVIVTGPAGAVDYDLYLGNFTGPPSFGNGGTTLADIGSGDRVGFYTFTFLFVPRGYVSDNSLSDTSIYENQTFSTLGVTPGTYEWTWGVGADQNFTVQAVPEPSVSVLLVIGILFTGVGLRQLRHRSEAA
jgi:hypothetical protein